MTSLCWIKKQWWTVYYLIWVDLGSLPSVHMHILPLDLTSENPWRQHLGLWVPQAAQVIQFFGLVNWDYYHCADSPGSLYIGKEDPVNLHRNWRGVSEPLHHETMDLRRCAQRQFSRSVIDLSSSTQEQKKKIGITWAPSRTTHFGDPIWDPLNQELWAWGQSFGLEQGGRVWEPLIMRTDGKRASCRGGGISWGQKCVKRWCFTARQ